MLLQLKLDLYYSANSGSLRKGFPVSQFVSFFHENVASSASTLSRFVLTKFCIVLKAQQFFVLNVRVQIAEIEMLKIPSPVFTSCWNENKNAHKHKKMPRKNIVKTLK